MTAEAPEVVVVGAASRDVTDADPRGWRLGGAVAYSSLLLGHLGLRVGAVVGVDAAGTSAPELGLVRAAGVDVRIVPLAHGPVFVNREQPDGREQVALELSDRIPTSALSVDWLAASALLLVPVAGELGSEWATTVDATTVAVGWQGLLRELSRGQVVRRSLPVADPLVARADLVGVSVDDLPPGLRLSVLVDLIKPGATVVVTRGAAGGTALTSHRPARSSLRAYPAVPADRVLDPTGAGDVFLAALLAASLDGERLGTPDWASRLTFAASAASLCVERPGLAGVPTLQAILRRAIEVA